MSDIIYTPSVHKPATKQELQQISRDLHYGCSEEQLEAITEKTNGALHSLEVIDSLTDPVPQVKYPRTPGYRPDRENSFGNSWAWRCDIQGAASGKLHGKTVAIKDNCAVAGVPMSNGSRLLEGYIPEYDATVVTRILDAGGRILGKATCDDFCLSSMGYSSVDGYIHNPKYAGYRVGGSSGGSAVLVAGGQVDLAIGGDQGGSIRIPAAWTGTVGIKATFGLVPYTGLVSVEPTVDHAGPIARNVTDCALFLEVIAGQDSWDNRTWPTVAIPEYSKLLEADVKGKKLGVLREGFATCEVNTQQAVHRFLSTVGQAGLETKDVSVPYHKHGLAFYMGCVAQGAQECLQLGTSGHFLQGWYPTTLEKEIRQGLHCSAELLSPGVKTYTMFGELVKRRHGNHYYSKTRNLIVELSRQYDEALKECDVIVMPTLTHTAAGFPLKQGSEVKSQIEYLSTSNDMLANTCVANLTGHPALTLPLGKIGYVDVPTDSVMIVGRKYDELTVLQVARALEKIIPARN